MFNKNTVARLNDGGAFPFIAQLRHDQEIVVPVEQGDDLLEELMTMPRSAEAGSAGIAEDRRGQSGPAAAVNPARAGAENER